MLLSFRLCLGEKMFDSLIYLKYSAFALVDYRCEV